MEKAYKAWGVELTVENTAWELGLDRFVSLKNRRFIGADALLAQRERGIEKRFQYVKIETGDSDVIGGEPVFAGDVLSGVMVSGAYGHRVGKNLGFALMSPSESVATEPWETEIMGQRHGLTTIAEPAFDPDNVCPGS